MLLCIIRTPLLEVKSAGKNCGLYTGKDGTVFLMITALYMYMCMLYVNFRSKVRPRTFGCFAMGRQCCFKSEFLSYSIGSGVNRVQVVLSRFSVRLLCLQIGSWPNNRTNAGSPQSEFDYTSKSLIGTNVTV